MKQQSARSHKSASLLVEEILASLEARPGIDSGLLAILKETIVAVKPHDSAQIDAIKRIENLAARRAGPAKPKNE
jgi:hypothetical protein